MSPNPRRVPQSDLLIGIPDTDGPSENVVYQVTPIKQVWEISRKDTEMRNKGGGNWFTDVKQDPHETPKDDTEAGPTRRKWGEKIKFNGRGGLLC